MARVKSESAKRPSMTVLICTPWAAASSQAVCGTMKEAATGAAVGTLPVCAAAVVHDSGENTEWASRAKSQPTMPCAPLPMPEVTAARLAAVVAGKPTLKWLSGCISAARNGACSACALSRFQPKPSINSRQVAVERSSRNGFLKPLAPNPAKTDWVRLARPGQVS